MVHVCNSSPQEAKVKGAQVLSQPGLHSDILPHNNDSNYKNQRNLQNHFWGQKGRFLNKNDFCLVSSVTFIPQQWLRSILKQEMIISLRNLRICRSRCNVYESRVGKLWPATRLSIFVNKILLKSNHNHFYSHTVCHGFCALWQS